MMQTGPDICWLTASNTFAFSKNQTFSGILLLFHIFIFIQFMVSCHGSSFWELSTNFQWVISQEVLTVHCLFFCSKGQFWPYAFNKNPINKQWVSKHQSFIFFDNSFKNENSYIKYEIPQIKMHNEDMCLKFWLGLYLYLFLLPSALFSLNVDLVIDLHTCCGYLMFFFSFHLSYRLVSGTPRWALI